MKAHYPTWLAVLSLIALTSCQRVFNGPWPATATLLARDADGRAVAFQLDHFEDSTSRNRVAFDLKAASTQTLHLQTGIYSVRFRSANRNPQDAWTAEASVLSPDELVHLAVPATEHVSKARLPIPQELCGAARQPGSLFWIELRRIADGETARRVRVTAAAETGACPDAEFQNLPAGAYWVYLHELGAGKSEIALRRTGHATFRAGHEDASVEWAGSPEAHER